jgi:hypothetical protein
MKLEQTIEFFASIGGFMEIVESLVVVLEEGEFLKVRKVDGVYEVVVDLGFKSDIWVGKRVVFE